MKNLLDLLSDKRVSTEVRNNTNPNLLTPSTSKDAVSASPAIREGMKGQANLEEMPKGKMEKLLIKLQEKLENAKSPEQEEHCSEILSNVFEVYERRFLENEEDQKEEIRNRELQREINRKMGSNVQGMDGAQQHFMQQMNGGQY
ncbi:hypothetical protein [Vibrio sp. CyArs1]|uniref:hypothetical protein n=1 Tax=Vibrio sp. CyArs1 TaxID=2682577 RepID=UPI001F0675A9|nr:hypothetical protein [Vibrio sp. CyArs1]